MIITKTETETIEYSDEEIAILAWGRIKNRMKRCRELATEYLKHLKREKYYYIEYSSKETGYYNSAYLPINDEDYDKIHKEIADFIAEEGPFNDDYTLTDFCSESEVLGDIMSSYWHCIPGEDRLMNDLMLTCVDLEDIKYAVGFYVKYWEKEEEQSIPRYKMIELTDPEYIDLLSLKLFDEYISFYDLKELTPELFKRIFDQIHIHGYHYVIFMSEINNAAKHILEDLKEENKLPGVDRHIWSMMAKPYYDEHPEICSDDPQLFKIWEFSMQWKPIIP